MRVYSIFIILSLFITKKAWILSRRPLVLLALDTSFLANRIAVCFKTHAFLALYLASGVARGGTRRTFPPKSEKNCRKVMLFPKALFLATNFPKLAKNSIFYWIFIKHCQNFLNISQQFVFFVQTRKKPTQIF